jgi:hypothetical protein
MGRDILAKEFEGTENPIHHPCPTSIKSCKSLGQDGGESKAAEEGCVAVFVERGCGVGKEDFACTGSVLEEFGRASNENCSHIFDGVQQ